MANFLFPLGMIYYTTLPSYTVHYHYLTLKYVFIILTVGIYNVVLDWIFNHIWLVFRKARLITRLCSRTESRLIRSIFLNYEVLRVTNLETANLSQQSFPAIFFMSINSTKLKCLILNSYKIVNIKPHEAFLRTY